MENPMIIKAFELEAAIASIALTWTKEDDAAAAKEGWNLYGAYAPHLMEIERDDCPEEGQLVDTAPVLDDDGDAFAYVTVMAYRRSDLHMKALAIHNFYAKEIANIRDQLGEKPYEAPTPLEEVAAGLAVLTESPPCAGHSVPLPTDAVGKISDRTLRSCINGAEVSAARGEVGAQERLDLYNQELARRAGQKH
jgi:hypothetical protein